MSFRIHRLSYILYSILTGSIWLPIQIFSVGCERHLLVSTNVKPNKIDYMPWDNAIAKILFKTLGNVARFDDSQFKFTFHPNSLRQFTHLETHTHYDTHARSNCLVSFLQFNFSCSLQLMQRLNGKINFCNFQK